MENLENHYFDKNFIYAGSMPAGDEEFSPLNALRVAPEMRDGYWPVINAARDGWDLLEDHRNREGWVNGEHVKITALGPLPEGWSDTPPVQPDTRTPEEKQRDEDFSLAMASLPEIVAAQTVIATRLVSGDTGKMADGDIVVIAKGLPRTYRVWIPGDTYSSGEWVWFPERETILYEQRQPGPVTGQAHQPPGDENMYAVYRPVDPAAGTEADPKTLILGMPAKVDQYFLWSGALWKCLRVLDVVYRGREPGSVGMESYWERVRLL